MLCPAKLSISTVWVCSTIHSYTLDAHVKHIPNTEFLLNIVISLSCFATSYMKNQDQNDQQQRCRSLASVDSEVYKQWMLWHWSLPWLWVTIGICCYPPWRSEWQNLWPLMHTNGNYLILKRYISSFPSFPKQFTSQFISASLHTLHTTSSFHTVVMYA